MNEWGWGYQLLLHYCHLVELGKHSHDDDEDITPTTKTPAFIKIDNDMSVYSGQKNDNK